MPQSSDTLPLLYLGLILLGILAFGVLRGYQRIQKSAPRSQDVLVQRQQERQRLLQEIADLDDQYAQGMIEKQAYCSERQRIKQRLVELTIQCKAN
jgi:cell division protein FtsB